MSTIETIAAAGILGVGLVTLLTSLAPLAERAKSADELFDVASIADAIALRVNAEPFDTVVGWLGQPDSLLADRGGTLVAPAADPAWSAAGRKYFAITLTRIAELSPPGNDADAAWLAYDVRVTGPTREVRFPGARLR